MRFQTYLLEMNNRGFDSPSGRSKRLSGRQAEKLLKTKCSVAVDRVIKGHFIFRSVDNRNDWVLLEPSGNRISANTLNYYTLIMNNHPMWSDFPNREVICAGGSGRRAFQHGAQNDYLVFPYNMAKIGICPDADVWDSFGKLQEVGIDYMAEFNRILESLDFNDGSWRELKLQMENTAAIEIMGSLRMSSDDLMGLSVYDFVTEYMDPYENDFEVTPISRYNLTESDNYEVWTDSPCVMMEYSPGDYPGVKTFLEAL